MGKNHKLIFNSVEDFYNTASKPGNDNNSSSSTKPATRGWDFGAGWDGAWKLARRGWPDGLKKLKAKRDLLQLPAQSDQDYAPRPYYSDAGDEVELGRFLEGEPECWQDWQPEVVPTFGKVARIVVNCAASAGVSADEFFERGAAACVLADALETLGIRCEIWALPKCSEKRGHTFEAWVPVKRADESLELDRVAFMLAHPAFMRRMGFRLLEQLSASDFRPFQSGYGMPKEIDASEMDADGTIYFGRQHLGYSTPEQMQKAVDDVLAKFLGSDAPA